jgi:light-regulated signal transduction histidine kinase (bacteriophytochrome)
LLTQLYQNLIGNALKFSGDQPPIIQLTFEEREGAPVFGVKDNGIGIEPNYAREIFKPFRRLHGRAEYEGSGVGLAICRKIVGRHGGKIWVESEPGKGAHFRFTFPHRTKER